MKFKKLITLASLVGLITFLLPVVSSGNQFIPPLSEHVSEYLDAPLWYLFLIWYGAFVITFLLSLINSTNLFSIIFYFDSVRNYFKITPIFLPYYILINSFHKIKQLIFDSVDLI